jgi:hypothetical protein
MIYCLKGHRHQQKRRAPTTLAPVPNAHKQNKNDDDNKQHRAAKGDPQLSWQTGSLVRVIKVK